MNGVWRRLVTCLLTTALCLVMGGTAALGEEATDPVAELQAYLTGLGGGSPEVGAAVGAIKDALAKGADPAAVREVVRTMVEARASGTVAQRICEQVRIMVQERVHLGQVVSELRLALSKGWGLEESFEAAAQRARWSHNNRNTTQSASQKANVDQDADQGAPKGGGGEAGGFGGGGGKP